MAGIQLTGLASGMDWKTTVDQLMKIEQVPQDALKAKQAANAKVQAAFDALQSNLTALKTAAQGLQSGLSGFPRSATVTDTVTKAAATGASVSSGAGAALGTFEFDVTSLGSASSLSGSAGSLRPSSAATASAALGNLTLDQCGVTTGVFTVNGTEVKIENTSQTLNNFLASIAGSVTATFSDSTGAMTLEATTAIGSANDSSNFLRALGLSRTSASGVTPVTFTQTIPSSVLGQLKLGDLPGGAGVSGSLTINGKELGPFDSSSTLGEVVSAINSKSETGVTASIDALNGRLVLRSNAIGDNSIAVEGDAMRSVLGIYSSTLAPGQGITYTLKHNGVFVSTDPSANPPPPAILTSDSTTLDISKYGFGPTELTIGAVGKYSVQVTGSGASYKSKINTFISAYNSLKQMLDDSTKITVGADGKVQASVFSNRSDINSLLSTIRSKIYSSVSDSSVNSSYDSASKIGLGFDAAGMLSIIDSAKLDSALANSPSSVEALLNSKKSAATSTPSDQLGIATRIVNLMTVMTGTSGIVSAGKNSITTQNSRLQSQINAMTRSLAQTRASLERGFIAMEQAQSKYQNMTQQLTAAFK